MRVLSSVLVLALALALCVSAQPPECNDGEVPATGIYADYHCADMTDAAGAMISLDACVSETDACLTSTNEAIFTVEQATGRAVVFFHTCFDPDFFARLDATCEDYICAAADCGDRECILSDVSCITAPCPPIASCGCLDSESTISYSPAEYYCDSVNSENPDMTLWIEHECAPECGNQLQVITFAADATGEVFAFPNPCLPEGFETVDNYQCSEIDPPTDDCPEGQTEIHGSPMEVFCDGAESDIFQDVFGCGECGIQPQVVTFAADAEGALFAFPTPCLPEGFQAVDDVECPDEPAPSSNTSPCPNDLIAIRGTPAEAYCDDSSSGLFEEIVGCGEPCGIVPQVVSFAADAAGQLFAFPTPCFPEGFEHREAYECNNGVDDDCDGIASAQIFGTPAEEYCRASFDDTEPEFDDFMGCNDECGIVTQVVTFADDGEGNVVAFPSGCVPRGFTVKGDFECQGSTDDVCSEHDCLDSQVCVEQEVTCVTEPCPPVPICVDVLCEGHMNGETFMHGCNECVCDADGNASCDDRDCNDPNWNPCSETRCDSDYVCNNVEVDCLTAPCYPVPVCVVPECDGRMDGDLFPADDGCNSCSCDIRNDIGIPICTTIACPPADDDDDDSTPEDPCNMVDCAHNLFCTTMEVDCDTESCDPVAVCVDEICVGHMDGAGFDAPDGCNTCFCSIDGNGVGSAGCTEVACPPGDDDDDDSTGDDDDSTGDDDDSTGDDDDSTGDDDDSTGDDDDSTGDDDDDSTGDDDDDTSVCAAVDCLPGLFCTSMEVVCITEPCNPVAVCAEEICVGHMDGEEFDSDEGCCTCVMNFEGVGLARCSDAPCTSGDDDDDSINTEDDDDDDGIFDAGSSALQTSLLLIAALFVFQFRVL